jgi:hypothetical protein
MAHYILSSPNGKSAWTSTKQWPYYLLKDALPRHLHSSFNTPSPLEPTYQMPRPWARPQTPFPKTLSAQHKATGVFLKLFPLLTRDSTLSPHNKRTLYKLLIRPILTYAAPVLSNTSSSDYRHLQLLQSKCLSHW